MKKKILFELFFIIVLIFVFPMYIHYSFGTDRLEERAYKLWGVLKAMGATDEQAAGAIGNWQYESGGTLDETAIEGLTGVDVYNMDGSTKSSLKSEEGYHKYSINFYNRQRLYKLFLFS